MIILNTSNNKLPIHKGTEFIFDNYYVVEFGYPGKVTDDSRLAILNILYSATNTLRNPELSLNTIYIINNVEDMINEEEDNNVIAGTLEMVKYSMDSLKYSFGHRIIVLGGEKSNTYKQFESLQSVERYARWGDLLDDIRSNGLNESLNPEFTAEEEQEAKIDFLARFE